MYSFLVLDTICFCCCCCCCCCCYYILVFYKVLVLFILGLYLILLYRRTVTNEKPVKHYLWSESLISPLFSSLLSSYLSVLFKQSLINMQTKGFKWCTLTFFSKVSGGEFLGPFTVIALIHTECESEGNLSLRCINTIQTGLRIASYLPLVARFLCLNSVNRLQFNNLINKTR